MIMGQGWVVYELSGSPLMLGYLGAAASIPTIVVTLFGGALADRMNKRLIILITSLIVAIAMFFLTWSVAAGVATAWSVIAIAAVVSVVSGLDWPTRQAVFPLLIDRSDMLSAVALNSITWQSCRMVMPVAGGLVLAFTSSAWLFAACGAGFLAMFVVMLTLRFEDPRITGGSTLDSVLEGFRFIVQTHLFLVLLTLTYVSMFLGNSYMQPMPAFSRILEAGEAGYGILISATGLGSVLGTVIVGSVQGSRHFGAIMLASTGLSGVMVLVFAAVTNLPPDFAFPAALFAVGAIALFNSVYMIMSMTVLQLEVPDELRGRVMGLHGITYSLMPLGGLAVGALAALTGAPIAISVAAAGLLAVVVWLGIRESAIHGIDGATMR